MLPHFKGNDFIGLYECKRTGYKFWRPEEIAGNEDFYKEISNAWTNYYRKERWEYPHVRKYLKKEYRVLEIGCGRGYFLRSIEGMVQSATGIEFNKEAIQNKVTNFEVLDQPLSQISSDGKKFDVVCSFQVLEHIVDPNSFIKEALSCLEDDGTLILSTPNHDCMVFKLQEDIFDAPPHHIGAFNIHSYKKISAYMNAAIHKVVTEPMEIMIPPVTEKTRGNFLYRVARFASRKLLKASYVINNEPGRTILVFLKRNSPDL